MSNYVKMYIVSVKVRFMPEAGNTAEYPCWRGDWLRKVDQEFFSVWDLVQHFLWMLCHNKFRPLWLPNLEHANKYMAK